MTPFQPSRADGRSDRQVVYALFAEVPPDTTVGHDAIEAALDEGVDAVIDRKRVYEAVGKARKTLLKERRRYAVAVPGVGYRVIRADEHRVVAMERQDRAAREVRTGLAIVNGTRLEELDPANRRLHLAYQQVLAHLVGWVASVRQRQDDIDEALASIDRRVARLEGDGG